MKYSFEISDFNFNELKSKKSKKRETHEKNAMKTCGI